MIRNTKYALTIGWLYPELMSTYGDRGNIIVLSKRCEKRDISVEIVKLDVGYSLSDLKKCDLLFMGGAQDKQQKIVAEDLAKKKKVLCDMIEDGIPGLYICGAYQFLGKYYKEADGTIINGLGIFDLYTESPPASSPRLIGNIAVEIKSFDFAQDDNDSIIVGFENHGGRTYLGKNIKPLGKVLSGHGNNGIDKTEGAIYKNSFGSYLHGPILPKNPHFADYLITKALEKKYNEEIILEQLDDALELQAHEAVLHSLYL